MGGFICYEAIFPALVRRFAAGGAELLVNVTNDAWYGTTSAPHQHLAMAAFRAIENRRYLVRAANTGITAVVDPRGRVIAATRLFEHDRPRPGGALRRREDLLHPPRRRVRAGLPWPLALALVAATARRPRARMDGRRHH